MKQKLVKNSKNNHKIGEKHGKSLKIDQFQADKLTSTTKLVK